MSTRNWVLAEDAHGWPTLEIAVIGKRPKDRPYLRIGEFPEGRLVGGLYDENALRGLAYRILRALGEDLRKEAK